MKGRIDNKMGSIQIAVAMPWNTIDTDPPACLAFATGAETVNFLR